MSRRHIFWLVAGAGTTVLIGVLLVHTHLAADYASGAHAKAPAPCRLALEHQSSHTFVRAQTIGAVTIDLAAAPDAFGAYTFTVVALDATCAPLEDATVDMVLTMLDMPMAPLHVVASPIGPPSAAYQGQAVLMAGRWQALVRVSAQGVTHPAQATFLFSAT